MLEFIVYVLAFVGAMAMVIAATVAIAAVRGGATHHGDTYDT